MIEKAPVIVTDNEAMNRFEATVDGLLAVAEYSKNADKIVFTHTAVPEALRGRGVGKALAETGLSYARANHLRVVPVCPFFASYIKRHPEYQDLVGA